jgi:hypothetical protein
MRELAGEDAKISFEGRLSHTELVTIAGGSGEETDVLRRATLSPRLDFIIFPLTQAIASAIEKAVSSKVSLNGGGVIHVQIEKRGVMAFAAYDNFYDDCVVAYSTVPVALLDELVRRKVLHSYAAG